LHPTGLSTDSTTPYAYAASAGVEYRAAAPALYI